MKLTKLILAGAFFVFISFFSGITHLHGQTTRLSIDESNIEGQFNYVLQKSDKIEDSRIVKSWQLYRLKTHVLDSLAEIQGKLDNSHQLVAFKQQKIDSLNTLLSKTNEKLTATVQAKNSLRLFGIQMEKSTYKSIMWLIIAGLAFCLFLFIALFKRSNIVTVQTRKVLEETQAEFEAHRKRALAREEQIVRKLYDELNKYKNKVGQGNKIS